MMSMVRFFKALCSCGDGAESEVGCGDDTGLELRRDSFSPESPFL